MAQDIKGRDAEEDVPPSIKPIYDRLSDMKSQLDQLCEFGRINVDQMEMGLSDSLIAATHRWTLRETDLYK